MPLLAFLWSVNIKEIFPACYLREKFPCDTREIFPSLSGWLMLPQSKFGFRCAVHLYNNRPAGLAAGFVGVEDGTGRNRWPLWAFRCCLGAAYPSACIKASRGVPVAHGGCP